MEANPAGYIELQPFPQEKIENFLLNVVKEFKRRIETINTNQEITSLMITLDNQFLLVGTSEGLIMVYNPRTFENYPFQGHKGRVNCMANLDHNMIASAGEDKTIILWDLVNKTNLGSLSDSQSSILCLASSLKYNIIISGGLEDVIRICDVTKMQTIEELRYHKGYIKGIVFAKNDDLFISTGSDMKILIWNTERREVYKELQQESKITNLSYCHYIENLANLETIQRSVLVTSGEDKIIRLWDIETGERKLLPKHKSQIISMCPIQNSQYLITGSSKSVIYLWDVVKAKYETEFKLASLPKFLHCSPDGKFLYSAGNDKNLRKVRLVEDIERKDAVITHDDPYNKGENNINATAITPDSRFIYTIADDHILKKNDMIQSTSLELKVYEGPPKCMSINKAGNWLAIGFQHSNIKLWDLNTQTEVQSLSEQTLPVVAIDFNRESSKLVAVASENDKGEISVYDLASYTVIKAISVPQGIRSVCFSADSLSVIYATDNELHILGVGPDESEKQVLKGFALEICKLKINHMTDHLIAMGGNGMIDIWDLRWCNLVSRLNCVNDVEENQLDKIDETMINKDQLFKKMGGANTVMMGANKRAIQRKMSKLLCCSVSEDGDYLLVGTKSDEIQFWSLVDKILLGSIKLNSQVKEILLDNINGFIFVTSMNQVIRLKNPVKSKESDMYVMGPSLYSVLFVTYFKMFLEDEYDGDYPSHMNEWVILPWRINILHLFAYTVNLKYSNMALKGRCKFLSTTQKTTPLTLALDSKNKELIDLVIKKTAKYTALDWHIFARIEDELPRLNELATPSLSILYKSAFQRSKQPDLIQFGVLKTKEGHPFSSFSYHIDCNNFIKQDLTTKETEEFLIYRVSSFQFNMTMGNLEGINFLSSLISCDDPEVFNAPIINTIIRTKWNQVRPLMFAQAAGYLLFLVSLVVYTLSSVSPGTDTAMLALIGILNVFFFIYEILQLSIGFKNYISDLWNWLDMIRIFLIFAYLLIEPLIGGHLSSGILALILLVSFQRGLGFFRVFKKTRYMIRMLTEIFYDMVPFVIVLIFSTFAFTFLFLVLSPLSTEKTFIEALIHSYLLLFGAFDYNSYSSVEWCCFYVATVVNPLMMFNLLVAIMGETYNRVQESMVVADIQSMVSMIIEYEAVLVWRRYSGQRMHLQLCTTSNSEQEDTSTDIKLEKQAQEIMKDILSLQTRLENLNKENQQVYEGANKRVTEINKQGNLYLKKLEDQQFSFKQEVLMRLEKIRAKYYSGLI